MRGEGDFFISFIFFCGGGGFKKLDSRLICWNNNNHYGACVLWNDQWKQFFLGRNYFFMKDLPPPQK